MKTLTTLLTIVALLFSFNAMGFARIMTDSHDINQDGILDTGDPVTSPSEEIDPRDQAILDLLLGDPFVLSEETIINGDHLP